MNLVGRKFTNPRLNIDINVYDVDGKKWFIGKECILLLGYSENSKPLRKWGERGAIVWEENKKKIYVGSIEIIGKCSDNTSVQKVNNNIIMVNEAGLYQLIFGSTLTEAKEFQRWVFDEVLPSLNDKNQYIDKDNITNEQIDDTIDEAIEIKRQRDNLENGIRFNKKFKCDLKNYLVNLYPNIEDVYEQFIENMKVSGMLDEKGIPTDKFMEYNQVYNMFEHITKVSNKINVRLRLTNLGYINLAKRIYEKDGKIYLNKNYEGEE